MRWPHPPAKRQLRIRRPSAERSQCCDSRCIRLRVDDEDIVLITFGDRYNLRLTFTMFNASLLKHVGHHLLFELGQTLGH